MKFFAAVLILVSLLNLTACGGRTPEPIMVERPGDAEKICTLLVYEIENIEFEIHKLLPETKDNTLKNLGLGVAGFYTFFIPWLLIDFKNADAKEYGALQQRHEHLSKIATDKNCEIIPRTYPKLEEIEQDYLLNKGKAKVSGTNSGTNKVNETKVND